MRHLLKVALVGAQGVIGRNLVDHLATLGDWEVIGLSRRGGAPADRVRYVAVDLLGRDDCRDKLGSLTQVTHIFYTAFQDRQTWAELVPPNLAMLVNVVEAVEQGATLLLGGDVPPGNGAYYPPTVLAAVKPGMPAYDDEFFGPVAAIIGAKDEEDTVRIANDTIFGIGAAVFTKDAKRGERVARKLEAGATFVNNSVASDPQLPFGGIKESGYGRELGGYGIEGFVNARTVYVKSSPQADPVPDTE